MKPVSTAQERKAIGTDTTGAGLVNRLRAIVARAAADGVADLRGGWTFHDPHGVGAALLSCMDNATAENETE
jgi:hypothetical protein